MTEIPATFRPSFAPQARPGAIVRGPGVRFTVLDSRLLRLEYDPDEAFEDRASQVIWYREQPVPAFEVKREEGELAIITEHLHLRYRPDGAGFTTQSLTVERRESGERWHYGQQNEGRLPGTVRTVDLLSGATVLKPGLLSRSGWGVLDDSDSLVFTDEGWLTPRPGEGTRDLYFFGFGHDYTAWLHAYQRLAGQVPLLPRWALGNWWSRYWEYSQEELMELMRAFRRHDVPLSVCIVDMDWHVTDTGNDSSGWTGYTWERKLFPEPEKFLAWLHQQGLKTALNLHPAEGVHPHEAAYADVAQAMGVDPESETPIPFALAEPRYALAYFRHLHHPLEAEGVDFWWIDWQQGTESGLPGLDPLWWLNHLHFYDRARSGKRRGFIFSRWGGLGNHRYPVGFSGDSFVDWPSLAFQPHLTAAAANVCFGWWSHDIGGHMQGIEEAELYTRWVQFGVFSPILRLHSTKNPYHERRPWGYDAETFRITREAMQLRHALIPYLYTMAWHNTSKGIAPIRPLYHDYPEEEAAYHCPDQYTFGSELLATPFITPADPDTRLSRQVVWLPPGEWFHFFDGRFFQGDRWQAIYGGRDEIPVFARAGAIVPLGPQTGWGGVDNPEVLHVHIFPGASNRFELYEDDGETTAYREGEYALTPFALQWEQGRLTFTVEPVTGKATLVPPERVYTLLFRGITRPEAVTVLVNGYEEPVTFVYDPESYTLRLAPLPLTTQGTATVTLSGAALMQREDFRPATLRRMVEAFRLQTSAKAALAGRAAEIGERPELLSRYAVDLKDSQLRALLEVSTGAGVHYVDHAGDEGHLILWNNRPDERIIYRLSHTHLHSWDEAERFQGEEGPVPRFKAMVPEKAWPNAVWRLALSYDGLAEVIISPRAATGG